MRGVWPGVAWMEVPKRSKSWLSWVVNDTFGGSKNAIQLSIRSSRGSAHPSTLAHSTPLTRPRPSAVALQPFPAGQAAIRNIPRGEKSCITHCQESHHTASMDAQEGKSIKAGRVPENLWKRPNFLRVFPSASVPRRVSAGRKNYSDFIASTVGDQ